MAGFRWSSRSLLTEAILWFCKSSNYSFSNQHFSLHALFMSPTNSSLSFCRYWVVQSWWLQQLNANEAKSCGVCWTQGIPQDQQLFTLRPTSHRGRLEVKYGHCLRRFTKHTWKTWWPAGCHSHCPADEQKRATGGSSTKKAFYKHPEVTWGW